MRRRHRERNIEAETEEWMNDERRQRNVVLGEHAEKRGLTVTEFLRMAAEADSRANAGNRLALWKKQVASSYREWHKFLDNFRKL